MDRRAIQNFDWMLFLVVFGLVVIGLLNLWSSTHVDVGMSGEVRRQLVSLGIGFGAFIVTMLVDYRHFERFAWPFYLVSVALVALTLVVGTETRGSQGWLLEGRVQPAELAKIGMILALARHFHRNPAGEVQSVRELLKPAGIIALPVGLIVLQRDMGVALLTLLIGTTYLAFVRIPLRAWVGMAALAAAALASIWFFALAEYQRNRILDVVDPGRDPLASGYQVNQSRIAIGSGGLIGKGFMEGTQTQLRFLPTQHTDFAFSVWAEEWGFLGSVFVLGVYVFLLLWGLLVARAAKDGFGTMLAVGVVGFLFWPAVLNIGMVLGLAPVIGVPLPFISYGGSALVVSLVAVGLLMNVSVRRWVF
ncbi:MAG: rod shape-determining protein RodA [Myxococcota bacterium]|nr:rod shape-determining protein RodA [Myxococcota bacterium]